MTIGGVDSTISVFSTWCGIASGCSKTYGVGTIILTFKIGIGSHDLRDRSPRGGSTFLRILLMAASGRGFYAVLVVHPASPIVYLGVHSPHINICNEELGILVTIPVATAVVIFVMKRHLLEEVKDKPPAFNKQRLSIVFGPTTQDGTTKLRKGRCM